MEKAITLRGEMKPPMRGGPRWWYLTMALSIVHRVSGVALAAGLVLLVWWLTARTSKRS